MRGTIVIDDDTSSYRSGSLSRNSSKNSFHGYGDRGIDWDEIDSIAEDSLSVASSASSGHRKRRGRRPTTSNATIGSNGSSTISALTGPSGKALGNKKSHHLEALEAGTLSRYASASGTTNHRSGTGARNSSKYSLGGSTSSSAKRKGRPKGGGLFRFFMRTMNNSKLKRMMFLTIVVIILMIGIHFLLSTLIGDGAMGVSGMTSALGGTDRKIQRALTRALQYYHDQKPWPISVREEQDDFELLNHPTSNSGIQLSVPRFYLQTPDGSMETLNSKNNKPLSRAIANQVGRTTVEGSRDFSVRTIFVAIPSYRDWHCRYTLERLFEMAKYPERIRVGVVDQISNKHQDPSCDVPIVSCDDKPSQALCAWRKHVDVYEMSHELAVGAPFARHLASRMYRGEYYALQINAHTTFATDWDVELIEQLEATGNEMAILTTYLNDASEGGILEDGTVQKESRLVVCNAAYAVEEETEESSSSSHHHSNVMADRMLQHVPEEQPDVLPGIHGMPQLQPYWTSDFSFSRGHFLLKVPYDYINMAMIMKQEEEVVMAVRAFTHGYDFYTPERSVLFDSLASEEREEQKSFLENAHLYPKGIRQTNTRTLYQIIGMDDEGGHTNNNNNPSFGIGTARSVTKFFTSFGVHPRERITEHKLCNFVSPGHMHRLFQEHLRNDGMGLDYDNIHFRFHELQNNHDGG